VAQAIKNLVMDLEDAGHRTRYLITDENGKFPTGRCCDYRIGRRVRTPTFNG